MKRSITFVRSISLKYSLLLISVLVLAGGSVQGQTSATDGTTPATLAPGAPAGSYSLSDFEHINLFNGNLSAAFKLVQVTGRGSAQYNMTLPIQQRWRALNGAIDPFNDGNLIYFSQPESNWWDGIRPGYGPGVVQSRTVGAEPGNCNPQLYSGVFYPAVITRITFTSPNGSEHELVDAQTNGAVHHFGICGDQTFSRGKVFVSKDGTSGLTFISDQNITEDNRTFGMGTPSGVLKFPDGTQYRVDGGLVSSIRDRHGNRLTFNYGTNPQDPLTFARVISVTDSLNRVVTVSYANNTTIFYDQINFQGFGGASRIIRVHYTSLGQSLRAGYTLANINTLFPQYINNANDPNLFNPTVVSAIELPDTRRFEFQYNNYSELARVKLPTGGAVEYDHTSTSGVLCYDGQSCTMSEIYRRIVARRVYPDGASSVPEGVTTYSSTVVGMTAVQPVTVDHLNSTGTLQAREQHYFYGNAVPSSLQTVYWSSWKDGKEYQTDFFNVVNGTAGALMRRQTMDWRQRAPVSWCGQSPFGCTADSAPPNDPRIVETVTTLTDVTPNLVSKQSSINPSDGTIGFDQFNNPTHLWEYDWGSGSSGALLRHTHTEYVTDPVYTDAQTGVHMRRLPAQVIVYDGSNNPLSKTSFAYDETSFPLLTYTSVTGWTNPNTTKRGNPTTTSNWLNTNNTWLSAHTQFDQVGNTRKTWDPSDTTLINPTQIEYSADYHFAYPTTQISADPDLTTSGNGPAQPLTSTSTYDLSTGFVTSTTDPNGTVSQFEYGDSLDRLTRSVIALNTSAEAESVIDYDDEHLKITRFNDLNVNGDSALKSETVFDGFGRVAETRTYESASSYIAVQTHYDALGRADKTSNSFRQNETPVWTTTVFDALGRPASVTTPDGAVVKTRYSGNRVLVEDQQQRIKINVFDVFNRLKELWEITTADSATESVSFPGYPAVSAGYVTRNGYDGLDNLTSVSQRFGASGANQLRSFTYDSLKRLTGTSSPESGATINEYDLDSNLLHQTDARGIVSTYDYDELNRTTSIDYSNTAINPDVTQSYDGAANGKGRLWKSYAGGSESAGTNVEKTLLESYDPLGRPLILKQYFKLNNVWSDPYRVSRTYNLAGGVKLQTYPSDRFVTYNYDNVARLADKDAQNLAFTGNLGGVSRTYSSGLSYVPTGLLKEERFGTTTAIYRKLFYNLRQQLTAILVNTTGDNSSWDRGKILNQYSLQCSGLSCDATDNNGALRKQEVYIPAGGQVPAPVSWHQQYDYDDLNRLKRVHEYTGNTVLDWQQEYVYDRWSNRTISASSTWIGNSSNPPNPLLNEKQFDTGAFATSNRLYAPGDLALPENQRQMGYDAAGNLTKDIYTGYGNATFDANNRITAIQDNTGSSSSYAYNVEGRRTRRISSNQGTWQIYGFAGELLAEYPANGPVLTPTREYGYRNGQLLVIATSSGGGWGTAPAFQDNPLQIGVTTIQALHITQLRDAINALRSHMSMPAYSWTTSATTNNFINAGPIVEMRTALDQALGAPANGYAAGLAQNQPVLAVHIQELRDRVLAAWQNGSSLDLRWLVSDQLGTPRMIFDQSGSIANMNRHDYLPFGEELNAGIGLRTTAQRYISDNVRQKFTLKERDSETSLDYFVARYFSSLQGRFTGVDPAAGMRDDAQSWNRYSYARNSPLEMTDPDGRTFLVCDPEGNNCVTYSDDEFYRIRRETEGQYGYTGDRDFFEQGNITENGQVIATYRQVTIDPSGENGRARQLAYHMRRAINDPKTMLKAASNIIFIRLLQNRTGSNTTGPGGPNRPLSFAEMSGMLRGATKQKGNFGMGSGSRAEAQAMGEAWVGVGYRVASDGKTLVSADGLRVFRPPSWKPKWGKEQANFEWKVAEGGQPTGNGHLDIW